MSSLTSAEGLVLPKKIGGYLYLDGLTSIEGLVLPDDIGEGVMLFSLTASDKQELVDKFPGITMYLENPIRGF